ncbi:MAG: hypothetical protein H6981_02920 [Gammaproteobacteria bacterium]|nr:hypothetical protein [Gammaproteobacteria bacterium]MCP5135741.1 hypothetical protein [Gammaproteobacteria bacterium]
MSNAPKGGTSHHFPSLASLPDARANSNTRSGSLSSLSGAPPMRAQKPTPPPPSDSLGSLSGAPSMSPRTRRILDKPGVLVPPHAPPPPHEIGMTPKEATALRTFAVRKGADVYVRDGGPTRLPHVGKTGTRPKPAGLYNKTDKTGDHPGLVVTGPGNALDDHSGLGFDDPASVVRDKHGNTVHGDIDLQRVDRGGQKVPAPEYIEALNAHLRSFSETARPHGPDETYTALRVHTDDKVQHGAHDEWAERNSMTYNGGRNAGPLPGVTKFSGNPKARGEHYSTTAEYRQELRSKGAESTYSRAAYARGAQRDTEVSAPHSNPVQITGLLPKIKP